LYTLPVTAVLEAWTRTGVRLVSLEHDRVTVGKDPANDVVLALDPTVSRLHAVLERFPAGWCVSDLDSRNGTYVNGRRVFRARPLRHDDEIRVGTSRLVYRDRAAGAAPTPTTEVGEALPRLTPRERDVLVALCRPLGAGAAAPAATREVAAALFVTEAAVKQHLLRLYAKFDVVGEGRRARLADEALRRGAVALAELRAGA
jgi:DNA-binding CsgD family transcriptional regulator